MSKVIMGGIQLASQQDVEAIKKIIDEQYPTLYKYRGNVDTYDSLLLITDSAIGDVYNVLENDKNYAWDGEKWDDLGGMFEIDTSEFVKPKGHVNTVEDLPSIGQASGERRTYHFNLLTDFLSNNNEESPLLVEGYNYIFSTRKTNGHYAYVGTNYPEIIEGINILEFDAFIGVVIKVNATSEKPAIIHQVADYNGPLYYDSQPTFHDDTTNPVVIRESCIVYLSKMESDSWISSNIPVIKYTTPYSRRFFYYDSNGNFQMSDATNGSSYINDENYSLSNPNNNGYVYVKEMSMMSFASNYKGTWVTNESKIEPNSMYLVGPKNEVYIFATNSWVHVSNHDSYTKEETDQAIDAAVSDLLHYVGHYDTAEGLPSTGQPSGTAIANYFTDTVDRLNLTGITLPNMRGYQYCFGFIDSSNPSNYCYVLTNNPEIITSVGIANGYAYQEIVIDATPEKPAALYNCYSGYTGPIYREIQSDGSYNYYPYGATNGYSATKKTWLYGAVASYRMFGVLGNHVIKFSDYGYTGYNRKQQDNSGYAFNSYYNQSMGSKSYSNTPKNEGYIYNSGMFFIKEDEGMAVSFVTADSIAQENDLATVGEMNNMYLCVAGPEWIPLAQPHDSYSKEEIDAMIGEIDTVLDEILNEPELVEDEIEVPDAG